MDSFKYDELSEEIRIQNYQAPGETNRKDLWKRLSKAIVVSEKPELQNKLEKEFYSILDDDRFIPGGRIMANLGIPGREKTTLYNCYTHHPKDIKLKNCDSIDGIYQMLKAQAKTLKSEGGYGTNSSYIRPAGSYIRGIGSRTPGVLKFMELWDKSSEIITEGSVKILGKKRKEEKNKIRKGAQMLVLNVWHPEIEDFITAKLTPERLTKFNLSAGITNGFMEALLNDEDWDLKFPDTEFEKYDEEWFGDIEDWEEKGYPVIVYKTVKAKDLWELIMQSTYNRNDPGVLFLDIANKMNPLYYAEKIFQTNPCGEIPMSTGVCNLGSLNLVMFVKKDKNGKVYFDYEDYKNSIIPAVRYLDNINDISTTPLPEYKEEVLKKRRIGLGNMAWGSLHFMLGIRFGSEKSMELIENISKLKAETELLASAELGKEKGSFTLFDKEKYFNSLWWKTLEISDEVKKKIEKIGCMRNSHISMNAPTGNTGIYAKNVSGGIEPIFSREYIRWSIVPEFDKRRLLEEGFEFPNVGKSEWFETKHMKFAHRNNEQILRGTFNNRNYEVDKNRGLIIENLVQDYGWKFAKEYYKDNLDQMLKDGIFATAMELTVTDHIKTLIRISHFTNQANSKTVNVPNNYPYEDFKNLYLQAWKNNIKGITTYREGTATVVLEEIGKKDNNQEKKNTFKENHAPKRPDKLECDIHQATIKGEQWTIFIGKFEDKPYELFGGLSKYVHIPKKIKYATIYKKGKKSGGMGIYDISYGDEDDETKIHDIVNVFENATNGTLTRTLSLALRHGTPIQYIVEQLQKDDKDSDMYSFSRVISRVLKSYIKEGTKASDKKCEVCDTEDSIVYIEGCKTCQNCGNSKCG